MRKLIAIFVSILIGGGGLFFLIDKGISCHQANIRNQVALDKLFYSPNSIKWQIAYQTCSNIIGETHCPLGIEIDFSEKENLKDQSLRANFENVLSRFSIYDKECVLIKDKNRLKKNLGDLYFKVKEMPGSPFSQKENMAAIDFENSKPKPLITPQETYQDAVGECEIILKNKNPPSLRVPQ